MWISQSPLFEIKSSFALLCKISESSKRNIQSCRIPTHLKWIEPFHFTDYLSWRISLGRSGIVNRFLAFCQLPEAFFRKKISSTKSKHLNLSLDMTWNDMSILVGLHFFENLHFLFTPEYLFCMAGNSVIMFSRLSIGMFPSLVRCSVLFLLSVSSVIFGGYVTFYSSCDLFSPIIIIKNTTFSRVEKILRWRTSFHK